MPAIVKIGYAEYALESVKDATTLVALMAKAVQVKEDYEVKPNCYYPDTDRCAEVSMKVIKPSQLTKRKSTKNDIEIEPEPRALESGQLQLTAGTYKKKANP